MVEGYFSARTSREGEVGQQETMEKMVDGAEAGFSGYA